MCDSSKDDSGIFFVLGEIVNLVAKLSETDEKIVNKVCYLIDVYCEAIRSFMGTYFRPK